MQYLTLGKNQTNYIHIVPCFISTLRVGLIQQGQVNNGVLKDFKLASHWPGSGPNVRNDLLLVLNVLEHLLWIIAVHPFILFIFII